MATMTMNRGAFNVQDVLNDVVMGVLNGDNYPSYSPNFIQNVIEMYEKVMRGTPAELQLPNGNYFIVGDIHGDYDSFVYIFRIIYTCAKVKFARVVFLGDYVDRGPYGVEVLITLMILKILFPGTFFMLRGNHEYGPLNEVYSFKRECYTKFGQDTGRVVFEMISDSYAFFPISCAISTKIYCIHGGVPFNIAKFNKEVSNPLPIYVNEVETPQIMNALWNDPMPNDQYIGSAYDNNASRGPGFYFFGQRAVEQFMAVKKVELIVRGHQVPTTMVKSTPDNKVLTIFSSIDYWKMNQCNRTYASIFYMNEDDEAFGRSVRSCTCYCIPEMVRGEKNLLERKYNNRGDKTIFHFLNSVMNAMDKKLKKSNDIKQENANNVQTMPNGNDDNDIVKMGPMDIDTTSKDNILKFFN